MILVTGGAGYIGSHCALALLELGYDVVVFDNLSTGHFQTADILKNIGNDNFEFTKGDLLNPEDLIKVFEGRQIDAVIHFAAFSQVGESVTNPAKYYRNNVCGTLNLLDTMLKYGVKKIVFSSTAATYGEPVRIPIDENHPQNPINPYGMTKLMIEKIMDDYDGAYGLKSVRLRYFNVAGAQGRVGEWHEPETHLIPNILKSTIETGRTFNLYGDDYDTKDGTCVRDYINIEDLICAHVLALEYLEAGGKTDFFNLGTREGSTVKEVFSICEKVTDTKIPLKIMPRRQGDPAKLVADNFKAAKILGWHPEKTLEYSIKTAFEWEKKLHEITKSS